VRSRSKLVAGGMAALLALSGCYSSGSGGASPAGLPCPTQGIADYSGEPGFGTPEEALTWALETQRHLVTGPGDEDEYVRVRRSAEWIDFEYRVDGTVHHTWEVIRQDGQWGIGARSGCMPDIG
jgi:hypothetical protein